MMTNRRIAATAVARPRAAGTPAAGRPAIRDLRSLRWGRSPDRAPRRPAICNRPARPASICNLKSEICNPQAAFTLVELLIVMCIIAILAAILLPVFARARENARKATCQNNLTQIGVAMHLYAQDYQGHFPPEAKWAEALQPYLKSNGVLSCPDDPSPWPKSGFRLSYVYRGGLANDDLPVTALAADRLVDLHLGMRNVLRLDGSVKALKMDEAHWEPLFPGDKRPDPTATSRLDEDSGGRL